MRSGGGTIPGGGGRRPVEAEAGRWRRAEAGARVERLATAFGVARERLTAVGVGPVAPVATNATEEGRALNRRVELVRR